MTINFETLTRSLGAASTARQRRLARILGGGDGAGMFIVPLDHGLAAGPVVPTGWSLDSLVGTLTEAGVDAVVLRAGAINRIAADKAAHIGLIAHLNGASGISPDPLQMRQLTSVEEAVKLGADAVSFHLNVGSPTTSEQLTELGQVAQDCNTWSMPLLVMAYPRGPHVSDPQDPDLILHAVTIAAELGADIVKTMPPKQPADAAKICMRSPVPVVFAGGAAEDPAHDTFEDIRSLMLAGAAGMAIGRRLFKSTDVHAATSAVAAIIRHPQIVAPASEKEIRHVHSHH